jgi:cell division control protein 7
MKFWIFLVTNIQTYTQTNVAGTRGFRAPEVLLRCVHQSSAVDVWSAGVVLLSLLSGSFPFFVSNDDGSALVEIGLVIGMARLQRVATSLGLSFLVFYYYKFDLFVPPPVNSWLD